MPSPAEAQQAVSLDVRKFNKFLTEKLAALNSRGATVALRSVMIELLKRIVAKSPVDTGRSRAGWTRFLVKRGVPVPPAPNFAAGREGFKKSIVFENVKTPRKEIIAQNLVYYVVYLEFGWSAQAPAGMVRISVLELKDLSRKVFAETIQEHFTKAAHYRKYM